MPELRRESVAQAVEPYGLLTALALKAEAVLGYSGLRERLGIQLNSLSQTLNELGIEPFRMDDVNRYKEEKAREVEQEVLAEYKQLARGSTIYRGHLPPGTHVRARWQRVPLSGYSGEVPEFALSHAVDIKDRVPNAKLEVEELRVEKRYDPFLVVSCGSEQFYIDVWDEKGFEAQHG